MRHRFDSMAKIAFTANLFEWYAFSLTVFMAVEVGRLFFPVESEKAALMLSFSVFAGSYLARPFGSVFFGILGNRYGAAAALKLSMVGMAAPASLIAFLPTYETAGYSATAALVILKVLQGFSAGGETPLSGYFVSLNVVDKRRGLYCALVVVSGFLGMLLASGIVFGLPYAAAALTWLLGDRAVGYSTQAWRWPFLLCIPLSLWIYSLRASITAVPGERVGKAIEVRRASPLIRALVLVAFMEVGIYTIFVWLPNYLHTYLGVPSFDARLTNVVALLIFCLSMLIAGYAARHVHASHLVLIGVASVVCSSYPLFTLFQRGDLFSLLFAQTVFAVEMGSLVGVIFIVLADLFKDNWRSFGMATTYSISTAVFGGTAPMVATHLIKVTQVLTAPAIYIMAFGVLALPVAYGISVRQRKAPDFAGMSGRGV